MSGFKVTPKKPPVDPARIEAFAAGADAQLPQPTPQSTAVPPAPDPTQWESLDNKRRTPVFSLRLTDMETAKLKHITSVTNESMHELCLKAIQKEIDSRLRG